MKRIALLFSFIIAFQLTCFAQETKLETLESLKDEIMLLRNDVSNIQLNLSTGEKKFKKGILVSTIGYSVVITGGLMLGRKQDELGKALLVAGGATGVIGTGMMVDAFKYFGRAGKRTKK